MGKQLTSKVVVLPKAKLQLDRKRKREILKILQSHDLDIVSLSFKYGSKGEPREIRIMYREP